MPEGNTQGESDETFGKRPARLRKAAGYFLQELAAEEDISHMMLVYYKDTKALRGEK